MTIKEFIEVAIEGGWKDKTHFYNLIDSYDNPIRSAFAMLVLDPEAWIAVGKIKGWKVNFTAEDPEWQIHTFIEMEELSPKKKMLNMIHALWSGKTLEEYIATL